MEHLSQIFLWHIKLNDKSAILVSVSLNLVQKSYFPVILGSKLFILKI